MFKIFVLLIIFFINNLYSSDKKEINENFLKICSKGSVEDVRKEIDDIRKAGRILDVFSKENGLNALNVAYKSQDWEKIKLIFWGLINYIDFNKQSVAIEQLFELFIDKNQTSNIKKLEELFLDFYEFNFNEQSLQIIFKKLFDRYYEFYKVHDLGQEDICGGSVTEYPEERNIKAIINLLLKIDYQRKKKIFNTKEILEGFLKELPNACINFNRVHCCEFICFALEVNPNFLLEVPGHYYESYDDNIYQTPFLTFLLMTILDNKTILGNKTLQSKQKIPYQIVRPTTILTNLNKYIFSKEILDNALLDVFRFIANCKEKEMVINFLISKGASILYLLEFFADSQDSLANKLEFISDHIRKLNDDPVIEKIIDSYSNKDNQNYLRELVIENRKIRAENIINVLRDLDVKLPNEILKIIGSY